MTRKEVNTKMKLRALVLSVVGFGFVIFTALSWNAGNALPRKHAQTSANNGQIAGKIYFEGDKPTLAPINMDKDPVCVSEENGKVTAQDGAVNDNATLPNAFVYVKSSSAELPHTPPRNSVDLTQKGCMYEPHVLGIMVGQPLQVLTLDPTTHNIHVVPTNNRDWNVTQQPGSPSMIWRFTHPEIMIPVHCNEHPWMKAYIGVVDNPFFAVTGKEGNFLLKNVPPGQYTLAVWTATFGTQQKDVVVRAGETASADFTFQKK